MSQSIPNASLVVVPEERQFNDFVNNLVARQYENFFFNLMGNLGKLLPGKKEKEEQSQKELSKQALYLEDKREEMQQRAQNQFLNQERPENRLQSTNNLFGNYAKIMGGRFPIPQESLQEELDRLKAEEVLRMQRENPPILSKEQAKQAQADVDLLKRNPQLWEAQERIKAIEGVLGRPQPTPSLPRQSLPSTQRPTRKENAFDIMRRIDMFNRGMGR